MTAAMLRDDTLKHQIMFRMADHRIGLTCNCLRRRSGYKLLGIRRCWEPAEALAVYKQHLEAQGVKDAI